MGEVWAVIVAATLCLGALPAGLFMTANALHEGAMGPSQWGGLWLALAALAALAAFGLHMSAFSIIQYTRCPPAQRNYRRAAHLAGVATAVVMVFVALAALPFMRSIVTSRLPAGTSPHVAMSVAAAYFLAWGGAIAASAGTSLAAICGGSP